MREDRLRRRDVPRAHGQTRSDSRRVLTKTSVVRWARINSANTVVNLVPHLRAGDGAEFVARNLDGKVHLAPMAHVDDSCVRTKQARHFFDRLYRRGKADPLQPAAGERIEPRQRQRQMRAALVVRDGVNFVDDHGRGGSQHFRATFPRSAE